MKRKIMQFAAVILALQLCLPTVFGLPETDGTTLMPEGGNRVTTGTTIMPEAGDPFTSGTTVMPEGGDSSTGGTTIMPEGGGSSTGGTTVMPEDGGSSAGGTTIIPGGGDSSTGGTTIIPGGGDPSDEPEDLPQQEIKKTVLRVGLRYGSSVLNSANLLNKTGVGYRFGYYDSELNFISLGWTDHTGISVLRTTNLWYGKDSDGWNGYYTSQTNGRKVGCYHVQLPGSYENFASAQSAASNYDGAFPAWINGTYAVRVGAYIERSGAEQKQASIGGTIVGTSSYAVTVVESDTAKLLFQFDGGESRAFGVEPGMEAGGRPNTWFRGYTYYGGFRFERIDGGDLTVVNIVDLEDYARGVAPYEMNNTWPIEALKAQTVCARTYAILQAKRSRHNGSHFDICNTTHCQVYKGNNSANARTDQAVDETNGLFVYYNGAPAETYYYSCNGGASEDVRNVWSENSNMPYLIGVVDPYEPVVGDKTGHYNWTHTFTKEELRQKLINYGFAQCGTVVDFYVSQWTPTGNVRSVTATDVNGKNWTVSKEEIKALLGVKSIHFTVSGGGSYYVNNSTNTVTKVHGLYTVGGEGNAVPISGAGGVYVITENGTAPLTTGSDRYTITGSGWGHNVGMSQWGAYAMANMGFTYEEILKFYFTGIEVCGRK